eukprot:1059016-Rhodomonas_salina.1
MAIMIAQKHIKQMQEEITTPGAALALKTGGVKSVLKVGSKLARTANPEEEEVTAETLAAEISAEQSALAEKQRALALITTGNAAQSYLEPAGVAEAVVEAAEVEAEVAEAMLLVPRRSPRGRAKSAAKRTQVTRPSQSASSGTSPLRGRSSMSLRSTRLR